MSWSELDEHRRYWDDHVKIDRYRRALASVIDETSVVLDLGCGTGLLGLLALQAGARRVYAVDSGSIVGLARDVAAANGFADRHVAIRAKSTEVVLPELVDVVVGDQLGGFAFDAGVLEYYQDAERRLMKPGGVLIPSAVELRLGLVEDATTGDFVRFWADRPAGVDLSPISPLAANCEIPRHLKAHQFLGPTVGTVSLRTADGRPFDLQARLEVSRAGTMHALVGMFSATMATGVTMTNDPTLADSMMHRWQNAYPLDSPLALACGDVVHVSVHARPLSDHMRWSVEVFRDGVRLAAERHSSFLGEIICADDLADLRAAGADGW